MSKNKLPEYIASDHIGYYPRASTPPVPPHIAEVALGCVRVCLQRGEKAAAIAAIERAFLEAGHEDQFDAQTPLSSLGLCSRVRYALEDNGVLTVLALSSLTSFQLIQMPRVGMHAVEEVRRELAKVGRKLRDDGDDDGQA